MKIKLSIIIAIAFLLFGCKKYDDYYLENNSFTDVYFPYYTLKRTTVSGEGLQIKVGAYLGGIRNNKTKETAKFEIVDSILNGTPYQPLPGKYYSLSDPNTITFFPGSLQGFVTVKFDSALFVGDPLTLTQHYALAFRIVSTSVDSIRQGGDTTIIPIKYINNYEGYYYQIGSVKSFLDSTGVRLDTVIAYGDEYDYPSTPLRYLTTISADTVIMDGIGDHGGSDYTMKLAINQTDNSVKVISVPTSKYQVEQDGTCNWDPVHRRFSLQYKYTTEGVLHKVKDELIFRNRIRDGINEWRWDGFPGN